MWSPKRELCILGLLFLCHVYFFQIYPNFLPTNEYSRFLLVSAVVDYHTIQIDEPMKRFGLNQDRAVYQGHSYSDKAIGTSVIGIPVYFLLKLVGVECSPRIWILLLRVFCVTIPSILMIRPLVRLWRRMAPGQEQFIPSAVFGYAFGTMAVTYSMQFISYYIVGVFLFYSFYFIYEHCVTGKRSLLLLGGVFSGAAAMSEYPAVFAVTVLFLYTFWRLPRRRDIWLYILGAAPFAALMLGYNAMIFGTPFDVTYRHMADTTHVGQHAQGMVGISFPTRAAVYGLLFGRKQGLFVLSPLLVFGLPGFLLLYRKQEWKKEAWLFAGMTACYLFLYTGAVNWDYGWAFGPRYLSPMLPFLMSAVVACVAEIYRRNNPWLRWLWIFCVLISCGYCIVGTITFPFPAAEIRNPYFQLSLPMLLHGTVSTSLGEFFGLPPIGSVVLFGALLVITLMVLVGRPGSLDVSPWPALRFLSACGACAAVFALGAVIAERPRTFDFYARASAYYYMGNYQQAAEDLRVALNGNPDAHLQWLIYNRAAQLEALRKHPAK